MNLKKRREKKRIEEDFTWLTHQALKIYKKYAGEWIAVVNKRVVGVGKTATAAYKKAKKTCPQEEPLLEAVEKDIEVIYVQLQMGKDNL